MRETIRRRGGDAATSRAAQIGQGAGQGAADLAGSSPPPDNMAILQSISQTLVQISQRIEWMEAPTTQAGAMPHSRHGKTAGPAPEGSESTPRVQAENAAPKEKRGPNGISWLGVIREQLELR